MANFVKPLWQILKRSCPLVNSALDATHWVIFFPCTKSQFVAASLYWNLATVLILFLLILPFELNMTNFAKTVKSNQCVPRFTWKTVGGAEWENNFQTLKYCQCNTWSHICLCMKNIMFVHPVMFVQTGSEAHFVTAVTVCFTGCSSSVLQQQADPGGVFVSRADSDPGWQQHSGKRAHRCASTIKTSLKDTLSIPSCNTT